MVASWFAVQSTWLERELDGIFKRVHFFPERESIFRREEFKRAENSRERGEVCPGYLTSAFSHLPNGGLDQLDPMLGSGCCFVSPPNQ